MAYFIKVSLLFLSVVLMAPFSGAETVEYKLENERISRVLRVADGQIRTLEIVNKWKGEKLSFTSMQEFQLRISQGIHTTDTDQLLTADDFDFRKVVSASDSSYTFELYNAEFGMKVHLHYELGQADFYMRKYLEIFPEREITIERIDLEVIEGEINQPYQIKQITAQGPAQWKPGLGQPLYGKKEAFFLGLEFPASTNVVEEGIAYCGYLWGRKMIGGEMYSTYPAVIGVGEDLAKIEDQFLAYTNLSFCY